MKYLKPSHALILRICVETGLRISDVLELRPTIEQKFCVVEKKTKKQKTCNLSTATFKDFKLYLKIHKYEKDEKAFKMSRQAVYNQIKKKSLLLGFENISSHSARKLYAKQYYKKNGLNSTAKELNHDNINTTLIYLNTLKF